jgi:Spy/CpxP family protein refolding chaperone
MEPLCMKAMLSAIVALSLAIPAAAQSPYAGQEVASIKSLSAEEVESLRSGDGMGFAKLAELNRYPGPRHVLELADELALTQAQRVETEVIFGSMRNAAMALGEDLVQAERALDREFAMGAIEAGTLESALLEIGQIRARLRYVHLEAHLRQKDLLTGRQVAKYDELRGYRLDQDQHAENPHHHD